MSVKAPLTVAIIAACPFPWPRGTPIRAYRIAESIARLGHQVHVITYHLGEERQYPFHIHRINPVLNYTRTSAGPSLGKLLRLNPLLVQLIKRLHSQIDFDVVHAIHMEGLLIARKAVPDLSIVYDAHTSLAGELPDYFGLIPRRIVSYLGAQLDRWIPLKADHTISVSEAIKEQLLANQVTSESRISVIPNGVNVDLFTAHEHIETDPNHVIYTGGDAAYQRLDLLLRAFRLLINIRPKARLSIAGSGQYARAKALTAQLDLSRSVDIYSTDFTEERQLLASATIAVSPRTVCDGLPQKLLNYMAAGKAVIACEGSAKHVKQGITGLRVPNDDPVALCEAMVSLLDDHELGNRLGRQAREAVKVEHSWASVALQIEGVYYDLLGSETKDFSTSKVTV